MRIVLALLLTTATAFAQTYTQRGFLEMNGTLYPSRTANDGAHAVGESLFRYEGFLTPSQVISNRGRWISAPTRIIRSSAISVSRGRTAKFADRWRSSPAQRDGAQRTADV
jgi:hypothetical protein